MEDFTLEDAATHNAIVKKSSSTQSNISITSAIRSIRSNIIGRRAKGPANLEEIATRTLGTSQAVEVGSTARIKDEMWQIAVRRFIEMIHPINFSTRFPR